MDLSHWASQLPCMPLHELANAEADAFIHVNIPAWPLDEAEGLSATLKRQPKHLRCNLDPFFQPHTRGARSTPLL